MCQILILLISWFVRASFSPPSLLLVQWVLFSCLMISVFLLLLFDVTWSGGSRVVKMLAVVEKSIVSFLFLLHPASSASVCIGIYSSADKGGVPGSPTEHLGGLQLHWLFGESTTSYISCLSLDQYQIRKWWVVWVSGKSI